MRSAQRHLAVTLLAALAALTIASRWLIIAGHAQPVPFHDQWTAEGTELIEPWFAGNLTFGDFWEASNEHRPVLTRALAFAEFRITGQWNTKLEMLVNSLFYALTSVVLAVFARRLFEAKGWIAAVATLAALFALPDNYENAMWGFQSQFYLLVLLGLCYLGGTYRSDRIDATWIAAQIAGALCLIAMGGGMLAPVAAAAFSLFRLIHRRDTHTITTLLVALVLAAAGWATIVHPGAGGGPLQARTPAIFVEALLKLMAWPSTLWFLVPVMNLPWLLITVRALLSREFRPGESLLAVTGAWILLESVAIAYARGDWFTEIPPRYFDAFMVAFVVNAASLALLFHSRVSRIPVAALGMCWTVASIAGLWHFNAPTRTRAILAANGGLQAGTLEAVRGYITTGDPAALTRDPFVAHHFPSIPAMRTLLDNPGVRSSLPATVRGGATLSSVERATDGMLDSWPWLMGLGIVVLASTAAAILVRSNRNEHAPLQPAPIPWFAAALPPLLVAVVLVALGMHPWETNSKRRLARVFAATGTPAADFDIPDGRNAVFAGNGTPAELFFGTFIGADSFEGKMVSTTFPIDARYLVVPITGYPDGPGNSLRLEVLSPDGSIARKFAFTGPAPGEHISGWQIDVGRMSIARAHLVLVDGSTQPHGWLGVGTPLLTDQPGAVRRLDIALQSDRAVNARRFPAVLLAASTLMLGCGLVVRRRSTQSA